MRDKPKIARTKSGAYEVTDRDERISVLRFEDWEKVWKCIKALEKAND